MSLLLGQPIDAEEVERAISAWDPARFATLCNDVIWAAAGLRCSGLPDMTRRINAADDGADAEWDTEIDGGALKKPNVLLRPGWNVFQFKKRDIFASDRRRILSSLAGNLKGAVRQLEKKRGRSPDCYFLLTNLDLRHEDAVKLRASILEGVDSGPLQVEVVGAALLAALLNNHPHLKSAYFFPLNFRTWKDAEEKHRKSVPYSLSAATGREEEIRRAVRLIDDPAVRIVFIEGKPGIGKSRLALEATRHRCSDVAVAADSTLKAQDFLQLRSEFSNVVCILDDPPPEEMGRMVSGALALEGFTLVVTLPSLGRVVGPSLVDDERIQRVLLQPLSDDDSRALLEAAGRNIDYRMKEWIISMAGGAPDLILAAAHLSDRLHVGNDFLDQIGEGLEARYRRDYGDKALQCIKILSLMSHVGVSGRHARELHLLCDIFGDGLTASDVLDTILKLCKAGVLECGGSFVEVPVPILARRLAAQLIRTGREKLFALFGKLLDTGGQMSLLKRLVEAGDEETAQFWKELLAPDGPLKDLKSALQAPHLLPFIAEGEGELTAQLLERELEASTLEERMSIKGEKRRELVRAIEKLLFRGATSKRALRVIFLLAEAENEAYANNATGVLTECLFPLHPDMPLPLSQRLDILEGSLSSGSSTAARSVVAKVIPDALKDPLVFSRGFAGRRPPAPRPSLTYGELYDYWRDLTDILFTLASDADEKVRREASKKLPDAVAALGIRGRPADAMARMRTLEEWVREGINVIDISDLCGALRRLRDSLLKLLKDDAKIPPEVVKDLESHCRELEHLITRLEDEGTFEERLKRWAGRRSFREYRAPESERYLVELERLASEAIEDPPLLKEELFNWLLSPDGERSRAFFHSLGKMDGKRAFVEMVDEAGKRPPGRDAFAWYWFGVSESEDDFAQVHIAERLESDAASAEAAVRALTLIRPRAESIERVIDLVNKAAVPADSAARSIETGSWFGSLSAGQFVSLLKAIAGTGMENASTALDMIGAWRLHAALDAGIEDIAWKCLETLPPEGVNHDGWHFDQLAAELSMKEPDRGFRLLESLESVDFMVEERRWFPLERSGNAHRLWNVLHDADRRRLFYLMFRLALSDVGYRISWYLREVVDQKNDRELLISIAREDIEKARWIASFITSAREGFWPLVYELVPLYPSDEHLLALLASAIVPEETVIWGSSSQPFEDRVNEIKRALHDPSAPSAVRAWLREAAERLESRIDSILVWEYDETLDGLRRYIEDPDSPQRLWAIGRVLKYASLEDVRKMLNPEDINDALPQVDLPGRKRKTLEAALKVWRHEQ